MRHDRRPRRLTGAVVALAVLVISCAPAPGPAPTPATGALFYPEPFDFHYPDEQTYRDVAPFAGVELTLGETGSTTFVHVPAADGPTRVVPGDLVGPQGAVLAADLIDVGVVMFMDRAREPHYLDNISLPGGINQDVRERAPVVPMAIVPDEQNFVSATSEAGDGAISLQVSDHATAVGRAGLGSQFWVTVSVPPDFAPPVPRSTFRGDLTLLTNGGALPVPIEVTVLATALDEVSAHGRHVGVFQTVDQFDRIFWDTVMEDLRSHGVNTIFHRRATPEDYRYFRRYGVDLVLNADNFFLGAGEIAEIAATGFLPLFYGFDEPHLHGTVAEHVETSRRIRSRGGLVGTSGTLATLRAVDAQVPQTWWNITFATSWLPDDPVFAHFDEVRADRARKIADLEFVYPMTLLELYPLNTRLLYGLWLYSSELDGGLAWAYSSDSRTLNPYEQTDWHGVAFPAEFHSADDGTLVYRAMLPSYVWEAFRAGVTDMRYALTLERLLAERGTPAERLRFELLLEDYRRIYSSSAPGAARIDARNSNAAVRETREEMFDMLAALLRRP